MSAGYPSEASASKEELQVQVLGLHGDGFNLQVLTGSELRKMIRDRLPCKDGARVSVLRGTEKLCRSTCRREQLDQLVDEVCHAGSSAYREIAHPAHLAFNGLTDHWQESRRSERFFPEGCEV
eukprot:g25761.t1